MKISFLVLTYNHENCILSCLNSITRQVGEFGQNHTFELCIVDDHSHDNTAAIVEKWLQSHEELFGRTVLQVNSENLGTCRNLAKNIVHITGEYVKLIAGDDMLPCTSVISLFEALEDYDMVMGLPLVFDAEGWNASSMVETFTTELAEHRQNFHGRIGRSCFVNAPAVYMRRACITQEVVEFLLEFKIMEDYPIWVKLGEAGVRYTFLPVIAALYRRSTYSVSHTMPEVLHVDRLRICDYILRGEYSFFRVKLFKYTERCALRKDTPRAMKYGIAYNYVRSLRQRLRGKRDARRMMDLLGEDIEKNMDYIRYVLSEERE